jgi:2-dehydro-3-deoxyphosphogluconate aldolase / (4S)-4-hydroxy-2-oxoglutarate aldolase
MSAMLEQLRQLGIVPVIVIEDAKHAAALADALVQGGLPCAEVTFRTHAAADALRAMSDKHPDMLIGAGTVLSPKQAAAAKAAGAKFVVSPGFNPAVVDYCQEHDIPVYPGVATPTEIEMALGKDLTTVKFFPAEPMGGLNFLKAIAAPYGMMNFIPTGGVSMKNIGEYLAFKRVIACGGTWMAPADWIAAGDFNRVKEETAKAVAAVQTIKGAA